MKSSPDILRNRTRDLPQCLEQLRHRVLPLLLSCMSSIFTFQRVNAGVTSLKPLETQKILLLVLSKLIIFGLSLFNWELKRNNTPLHFSVRVININFAAYIITTAYIYIYMYIKRVTEGKIQGGIEVTGRQGRRRRKLLDDLKERRGYSHLKEKSLGRTMWRARFGRGFGPVVRQTNK